MTKNELRKIYLAKQKALSDVEKLDRSQQIAERFFERFDLENVQKLHVFLPIEKNCEIETGFVYKRIWEDFPHIEIVVPRVDAQLLELEHLKFGADTKLEKNRWHIFEPTESESVEIAKIDVVLVPLLCFDERGFRVGYGKGFYDKFLSKCRPDCLKIGLSYFAPIKEISAAQNFDVKLDFCVTPAKVFEMR